MDMDLRSFLKDNNHIITWEQKLKYVEIISLSLIVIHKAGYLHRDLHPGHILIQLFNNRVISMKISGLTFCGPINEPFDDIQSINPYIAPEVLRNQQYTYKTDIYCMGMIMWEISAGMPPFNNQDNINLKTAILEGIRPVSVKGTPSEYEKLMKECWDANLENRPNAETLYKEVSKLRIEFIKKSSVESSLNDNKLASLVGTSTHPSEDKRYVTQKYNFTPEDILKLENEQKIDINDDKYAFKRNFNYGKCTDCNRFKTSKAWCQSCDPWKVTKGWTSGNKDIDSCIKEFQYDATKYEKLIEWIPFDRLDNIQEVGKGGFGYVFSATWLDGKRRAIYDGEKYIQSRTKPDIVALKTLSDDSAEFLQNVDIAKDLIQIHEAGYIHCDFHSGNILQHKEELWLEKIIKSYIADLGLSQNNKESTLKKGVLPYIAPEILLGRKYTQAADIYGFGVVMAEITTGVPPFDGYLFDNDLAIKICCGLRPKLALGTPDCYIKLAESCMDSDPQKRPTATMLFDEFSKWYGFISESGKLNEKSEISNKFWEADYIIQQLPITTQQNLDSVYTSQFVDVNAISQRFSEEVKSGNITGKYVF
ncbi:kinase-like domain-containing protein [Gigaspora rosea]|uniref:Kinase-like domain-containing protein n=1 Tax=Gigaspora rosea TaxID=44941 RepID=A0A397UXC9_9GLOM|nr:kinase-like domain-containing protein [Gigaspora rosea]